MRRVAVTLGVWTASSVAVLAGLWVAYQVDSARHRRSLAADRLWADGRMRDTGTTVRLSEPTICHCDNPQLETGGTLPAFGASQCATCKRPVIAGTW